MEQVVVHIQSSNKQGDKMKTKLEEAFDNYVNNFDMKDKQINFKYRHSYKVKELMKELAIKFGLTPKEVEVAEVIGLLHDIGRFEQIRKKGSCSDCKTGIDHADESCVYLFDNNHITRTRKNGLDLTKAFSMM